MGFWCETCAVSNLPIKYDDDFIIFIIKKKQHVYQEWASHGEADTWYTPVSLAVKGSIKSNEEIQAFNYTGEDISELVEEIRSADKENYELMFVLKSMYSTVVEEMKSRHSFYNKYMKAVNEFIAYTKTVGERNMFLSWDDIFPNLFVKFFSEYQREMKDLLDELAESNDNVLKEQMLELFLFHYGLKVMRKMWHPCNGRGSQDEEYFLHKKIAEEIIKKEEIEKQKWLEENILGENQNEDDITKMYMWYL